MPRVIREQELSDIILGTSFMGAGGGGSSRDGHRLLDELKLLNKTSMGLKHT